MVQVVLKDSSNDYPLEKSDMSHTDAHLCKSWNGLILYGIIGLAALLGLYGRAAADHGKSQAKPVVESSIASYAADTQISGGLTIAGSETMQPLMAKLATAFRDRQPDVKVGVQGGGSVTAIHAFLLNQATIRQGDGSPKGTHQASSHVDLLASSTPLTPEERNDFRIRYGYEVTEIPIAMDAVAIYVHRSNPIQELTLKQVDAIFGKDRKRGHENITTWGQIGLKGEWEQAQIHAYGRDKKSGTRSVFIHAALLDGELKDNVREYPGPASEILAISRDQFGIGYAGIGFQTSFLRTVPLAEESGRPAVLPDAESAKNGTYPMSRLLYLYVKKNPGTELDKETSEFLKFVNSREGQEAVVRAGIYPLSQVQIAKNLQALGFTPMSASLPGTVRYAP